MRDLVSSTCSRCGRWHGFVKNGLMLTLRLASVVAMLLVLVEQALALGAFDPSRLVNSDATIDNELDASSSAAGNGIGGWVAAWDQYQSGGGNTVAIARSVDDGASWSTPQLLYHGGSPSIAGSGGDTVVLVWNDRFGASPAGIYASRSTDLGATWSAPLQIGTIGNTVTNLATDGAGVWMAAWVNHEPADTYLRFARSIDDGVTWSAEAVLPPGGDTDGDVADDPRLATDRKGTWLAAWRAPFGGIRISRSNDNGGTWGTDVAIPGPAEVSGEGVDVGTDEAGTWVVVWTAVTTADDAYDVYWIRSTDNGTTWSLPAPLYADYLTEPAGTGKDHPRVLYTANGAWLATWTSTRNLGGVTGSDADIHVVRSFDGASTWTYPAVLEPNEALDGAGSAEDFDNTASFGNAGIGATRERMVIGTSIGRRLGTIGDDGDIFFSIDRDECPTTPAVGCVTPTATGASRLLLRDASGAKDQFVWKWKLGGATAAADFGDPTSTTNYALCLYDKVPVGIRPVLEKHARAVTDCGGTSCWTLTAGGYRYRDSHSEQGAIRDLRMQSGDAGHSSLNVRAVGANLSLPNLPLAKNPSVKVQLLNIENGKCWEATFSAAINNDSSRFKARSD